MVLADLSDREDRVINHQTIRRGYSVDIHHSSVAYSTWCVSREAASGTTRDEGAWSPRSASHPTESHRLGPVLHNGRTAVCARHVERRFNRGWPLRSQVSSFIRCNRTRFIHRECL